MFQTGLLSGPQQFGPSWLIVGGFLFTCGHSAAIMALAMHIHGVREEYRILRPSIRRLSNLITLESCIVGGLAMIVASMLGFATVVLQLVERRLCRASLGSAPRAVGNRRRRWTPDAAWWLRAGNHQRQ